MGNAAEGAGRCALKREFVIEAERDADLLEQSHNLGDLNDALRRLARHLHAETDAEDRLVPLQARPRGPNARGVEATCLPLRSKLKPGRSFWVRHPIVTIAFSKKHRIAI